MSFSGKMTNMGVRETGGVRRIPNSDSHAYVMAVPSKTRKPKKTHSSNELPTFFLVNTLLETKKHLSSMMGCGTMTVRWCSCSTKASLAQAFASWSGPSSTMRTTQRTSRLVLPSPRRWEPFHLGRTPHFVSSVSCWRMFSSTPPEDDEETDDRKTQPVFDYFNNIKFFRYDEDRIYFENRFSRLNEDDKRMLMKTTHEFFELARKKERWSLGTFLLKHIHGCQYDNLLGEYVLWKRDHGIGLDDHPIDHQLPIVNVDFQIANTRLSHTYDLERFSVRVDHLFDCHEKWREREKYVAPYFCFVQSSGMGKTKILWEYQNRPDDPNMDPNERVTSFVILPTDPMTGDEPIFPVLKLDKVGPFLEEDIANMKQEEIETHYQKVFRRISAALDKTLKTLVNKHLEENPERKIRRVALLFDEAQHLLKEEFGLKAFRFRCIRRWLMERPSIAYSFRTEQQLIVVAVFAGTSLKLTNVPFDYNDPDLSYMPEPPSRNNLSHPTLYYRNGKMYHHSFWQTSTTGSCLDLLKEPRNLSEYERAAYYGRPLFALLQEEGVLHGKTQAILYRMLHLRKDWARNNRIGLFNLLSSRVQMGQVSVEMASDLVANSYATLSGCNEDSTVVHLGYLPDPVSARLAMCMMDEDFLIDVEVMKDSFVEVQGKDKEWWSNELKGIFSDEMVHPEKGEDTGEIFVALYMLFCGDRLRKLLNVEVKQQKSGIQPYSQFSVSLDAWLQLMISGGNFHKNGKSPGLSNEDSTASVGFIQVCRNPLGSYKQSWKRLSEQAYLKYIYESGIGFSTCNQCDIIDMVVPIRIKSNEEGNTTDGFCYVPMLISIQSDSDYSDGFSPLKNVEKRLKRDGISQAFCLLIVFGSSENTKPFAGKYAIQKASKISEDLLKGVVKKAIRVPHDDVFGLSTAFASMLPTAQFHADMLDSHAFLKAHGSDPSQELKAENALDSRAPKTLQADHDALHTALMTGLRGNPQDAESPTNQSPPL